MGTTCKFGQQLLSQTEGTCWFNSVINSFITSRYFSSLLKCKIQEYVQKLDISLRTEFEKFDIMNACPVTVSDEHILKVLNRLFKMNKIPLGNTENPTKNILNQLKIRKRPYVIISQGIANRTLKAILQQLQGIIQTTYLFMNYKQLLQQKVTISSPPSLLFIEPSMAFSFSLEHDLPLEFQVNDATYVLDHAVLYFIFSITVRHYICAYVDKSCSDSSMFAYDSAYDEHISFAWNDKNAMTNVDYVRSKFEIAKDYNLNRPVEIAYICYVRKDMYIECNSISAKGGYKRSNTLVKVSASNYLYKVLIDQTGHKYIQKNNKRVYLHNIRGKYRYH